MMPKYRDAAYGDETVVLENRHLWLEVHKRILPTDGFHTGTSTHANSSLFMGRSRL